MKTFRQSAYFITRECNTRCGYCKVPTQRRPHVLGTEEAMNVLMALKLLDFDINVIFGGEPMMRQDIYRLLRHASDIKLPYAFISNSMLVDSEVMDRLITEGNIQNYTASVDSLRRDDERSMAGHDVLLEMKRRGVPDVVANIVITKKNMNYIGHMITYFSSMGIWTIVGVLQDGDSPEWQYRSKTGLGLNAARPRDLEKIQECLLGLKDHGYLIHNVRSYLENLTTYGTTLSWKCSTPAYVPIDEDGSVMCCVDYRGSRVDATGFSVFDLLDDKLRQEYIDARALDVAECKGCYYNHSWQVENLGDFDLTHKS